MIKLFSWNINGIRACLNKNGLQNLINQFNPDIICLQEIKAQQDQVDLSDFNKYIAIWNSATKKGYSGTMVLTKKSPQNISLNFNDNITNQFNLKDEYGDSNTEGRLISLEFDKFYLITVYTPNSKGDLSRLSLRHIAWDQAFLKHCNDLKQQKPVLISGDLNVAHNEIDLARPKDNVGKHGFTNEERQGFSNLLNKGFSDIFRDLNPKKEAAYTWWTHWQNARAKNIGWRIDYWLISDDIKDSIIDTQIHPDIMGSDHCPISLNVEI